MAVSGAYVRLLGSFELVHDGRRVEVVGPVGMAIVAALAYRRIRRFFLIS